MKNVHPLLLYPFYTLAPIALLNSVIPFKWAHRNAKPRNRSVFIRSHIVNSFKRNTVNFRAKDERVRFVPRKPFVRIKARSCSDRGRRQLLPPAPDDYSRSTIALGRRSLPRAGLPLASSEASQSCLPPHPKHQCSRRSARIVELPSRYNHWAAHLSR